MPTQAEKEDVQSVVKEDVISAGEREEKMHLVILLPWKIVTAMLKLLKVMPYAFPYILCT